MKSHREIAASALACRGRGARGYAKCKNCGHVVDVKTVEKKGEAPAAAP